MLDEVGVGPRNDEPWGRHQPSPWRNVKVRRIAIQAVFLALVAGVIFYLYDNLTGNLRRLGISTGYGWLNQTAGFDLAYSDFDPSQSFLAAIVVGIKNTALVSVLGIVLATVIGLIVGVGRLSTNWLVRKAAGVYVETLRNVPVLIVILFFYLAVALQAPPIRRAVELGDLVVLSNRGLVLPWFRVTEDVTGFLLLLAAGIVAAAAVGRWRTRRFDRTGVPHHRVLWAGGALLGCAVAAFLAGGRPLAVSLPELGVLSTEGGLRFGPEYAAVLVGVTIYTASHIAEIVRGSILAVPRAQGEAATALGLSGFQRLRHVVLPQALRIMIPPLGNQYLSLTKNTSLAVAVAFTDITRIIQIMIGQQAPAPQAILLLMLIYLGFSLTISLLMNLFNWRLGRRWAR